MEGILYLAIFGWTVYEIIHSGGIGRRIDKVQEGLSPLIKNPYVRCKSLPMDIIERGTNGSNNNRTKY